MVVVGGVTLRLVEEAALSPVLNGPPPLRVYTDREEAQSSSGDAGEKVLSPSDSLHSLWSWI